MSTVDGMMATTESPDEYWPKAVCEQCTARGFGGIRYAPVDMTCVDCGGPMTLMQPRDPKPV